MYHYAWLIFVFFLVETGFCHVGQAGLELLASSNSPTLASQIAEITVVSDCTPLEFIHFFNLSKVVGENGISVFYFYLFIYLCIY